MLKLKKGKPETHWLGRLDQRILRAMRTTSHGPVEQRIVQGLGMAGEWAAIWVALGAAGALTDANRRRRYATAALVGPAAIGINFVVKVGVGRERPLIEDHPPLAKAPSKLSFPSAHATSSLAAAVALSRVDGRNCIPAVGLALAICLSRPYLGMHYPSDVAAGVMLGTALGALVPGLGENTEARLERLADLHHSTVSTPDGAAA